jgi:hypothetical protein
MYYIDNNTLYIVIYFNKEIVMSLSIRGDFKKHLIELPENDFVHSKVITIHNYKSILNNEGATLYYGSNCWDVTISFILKYKNTTMPVDIIYKDITEHKAYINIFWNHLQEKIKPNAIISTPLHIECYIDKPTKYKEEDIIIQDITKIFISNMLAIDKNLPIENKLQILYDMPSSFCFNT